jgi:hypothetical protein
MSTFFMYLKFYFEPKSKDIRELAMASAREFWKTNKTIPKNMDNFQSYQQGYVVAFRHSYAKSKVESSGKI